MAIDRLGLTDTDSDTATRPPTNVFAGAARLLDYWAIAYRRTWKGSVISSFVTPLFFVLAMGVLLGGFIEGDPDKLEGATSYLAFVAPGMIAAQAMTTAFGETTYPVMGMIKWHKAYFGMVATPLRIPEVILAHLCFVLFRVTTSCAVFIAVMAPFGVFSSLPGVIGAFVVQLLIGLAFATPIYAFSAGLKDESAFALVFRLGMIPLFLFSGAFFPVSQLPNWIEWLAYVSPLWHAVELSRDLSLGTVDPWMALLNVGYLLAWFLIGTWLAVRGFTRKLVG
jgi:lipooligosaccharide transport system permease protein